MIDAAYIDKTTWGDGPWQAEPDRKEWTDAATGLVCLAVRVPHHGAWCGYVGVPPEHPAYGLSYDGIPDEAFQKQKALTKELLREANGDFGNIAWPVRESPAGVGIALSAIAVHGGLTYAAACSGSICHATAEGEQDKIWWFGFDHAHAWDYCPGMAAVTRKITGPREYHRDETYRDLAYVEGECASLARQLAALT